MAATNKQQTWSGIKDESKSTTEKDDGGKVACPLYAPPDNYDTSFERGYAA